MDIFELSDGKVELVSNKGFCAKLEKRLQKYEASTLANTMAIYVNDIFKKQPYNYSGALVPFYSQTGLLKTEEAYLLKKDEPVFFFDTKNPDKPVTKLLFDGKNLTKETVSRDKYLEERVAWVALQEKLHKIAEEKKVDLFKQENNLTEEAYDVYLWDRGPCSSRICRTVACMIYPELTHLLSPGKLEEPKLPITLLYLIRMFEAVPESKEKFLQLQFEHPVWKKVVTDFDNVEKIIKKDYALYGTDFSNASFSLLGNLNKLMLNWKSSTDIENYGAEVLRYKLSPKNNLI